MTLQDGISNGYWDRYHKQVVIRALALLGADMAISARYVHHLELDGMIDIEELRGCGKGSKRRWFLA